MKYILILLTFNLYAQEVSLPVKTPREIRIEKERKEFDGKVWVETAGNKQTSYALKIYCEDIHGADNCRAFPTDDEKVASDISKESEKAIKEQKKASIELIADKLEAGDSLSKAERDAFLFYLYKGE